jgi:hypothetical protein
MSSTTRGHVRTTLPVMPTVERIGRTTPERFCLDELSFSERKLSGQEREFGKICVDLSSV